MTVRGSAMTTQSSSRPFAHQDEHGPLAQTFERRTPPRLGCQCERSGWLVCGVSSYDPVVTPARSQSRTVTALHQRPDAARSRNALGTESSAATPAITRDEILDRCAPNDRCLDMRRWLPIASAVLERSGHRQLHRTRAQGLRQCLLPGPSRSRDR